VIIRSSSYQATFREDLGAICERLKPATVGAFNLAEISFLPLEYLLRSGSHVWFVEAQAGRMEALIADEIVRETDGRRTCLACDAGLDARDVCGAFGAQPTSPVTSCEHLPRTPRADARCARFVPGRRIQVIHGDGGRGRGSAFATRVEAVVAAATTPAAAVDDALELCARSSQVNVPLPIEDGALDLVISVLAPARLMAQPYTYFAQSMARRFGARVERVRGKLRSKLDELQTALFRTQLDAHIHELARLAHPRHGRLYFATIPAEVTDGVWSIEHGVAECFEALARVFAFDFDTFPAEAFLRHPPTDRSLLIQAALLRPKTTTGGSP